MRKLMQIMLCLVLAACLAGCSQSGSDAKEMREPRIIEEVSQLEGWKEQLEPAGAQDLFSYQAIRGLELQQEETVVFAASYEPRSYKGSYAYWDISVPYQSVVTVDTEALYELFAQVAALRLEAADGVSSAEAGLERPACALFIAYDQEQTEEAAGRVQPDRGKTILIGAADGAGHYYAKTVDETAVWLVDKELTDRIFGIRPFDYILKTAALVERDSVERTEVRAEGLVYTLQQTEEMFLENDRQVDEADYNEAYAKLLGIMITGECEELVSEAGRELLLSLTFYRLDEAATDVVVTCYGYDDTSASVAVNGHESFLADRAEILDLVQWIGNR